MSSGKAARRAAAEAALEPPAPDLAKRFPVCRWLAGDVRFAALAHGFAELCRSRSLLAADDMFGAFIEAFEPAASLPYLTDVARLEAARARSAVATDPPPLAAEELAGVPSCAWEEARLTLHPAIEIVRSAHPIVSILEAYAAGRAVPPALPRRAEDALVQRRGRAVSIRRMPAGSAVFLQALLRRSTLAGARQAASAEPGFDMVVGLAMLFAERMIVGIEHRGCGPRQESSAVRVEA
jgi:hypothetical protein